MHTSAAAVLSNALAAALLLAAPPPASARAAPLNLWASIDAVDEPADGASVPPKPARTPGAANRPTPGPAAAPGPGSGGEPRARPTPARGSTERSAPEEPPADPDSDLRAPAERSNEPAGPPANNRPTKFGRPLPPAMPAPGPAALGSGSAADPQGGPRSPAAAPATAPALSPPALTPPHGNAADLFSHFRARQLALLEQDPKRVEAEAKALRELRADLTFDDFSTVGEALVREGQRRLSGKLAPQAVSSAQLAVDLAPDLPAGWWLLARARLAAEGFAGLQPAANAARAALLAEFASPLGRKALAVNLAVAALWSALLALALVVAILAIGALRYALHDFHHRFPKGAAPAQTALLGLILVAVPWLFNLGPFAILASLAAIAWAYLEREGRAVTGLALVLALGLPYILAEIAVQAEVPPLPLLLWDAERDLDAEPALAQLTALVAETAGSAGGTDSGRPPARPEVFWVLGHRAKRLGQLEEAERLYRQALALAPGRGELENNLGNVLLLRGDLKGARALYERAIDHDPSRAAPYFNLGQAFSRLVLLDQSQESQRHALELDRPLIEPHLGQQTAANRFVIDTPVTFASLSGAATDDSAAVRRGVRAEVQAQLFGPLASVWPAVAGGLALGLALLGSRRRVRPSAPCRKCGRPVCARCDPGLPDEELCGQCVSVFLRKSVADPPARIRKEARVREYQVLRQRGIRALALLSGGGGHVAAGDVALGALLLFAMVFSAVTALGTVDWLPAVDRGLLPLAATVLGASLGAGFYLFSVRDLFARTR